MANKHVWMRTWVLLGFVGIIIVIGSVGCIQPVTTTQTVTAARSVTTAPALSTAQPLTKTHPVTTAELTITAHPVTTALVVRHAERSNDSLTIAGQARAEELVHVAGDAGVTAVYATQFIRTQQTVQTLADHLDLPVDLYSAIDVEGLVAQVLSDHAGEVVFIAGHSDTVPAIIEELGGAPVRPIAANEYDNLFIVTVYGSGRAEVIHLNYGDAD